MRTHVVPFRPGTPSPGPGLATEEKEPAIFRPLRVASSTLKTGLEWYRPPMHLEASSHAALFAAFTPTSRSSSSTSGGTDIPNAKRAGTVGFALRILQRRLASLPEAVYTVYQSLRRPAKSAQRQAGPT